MTYVMPEQAALQPIITCTVEGIIEVDDLRVLAMGGGGDSAQHPSNVIPAEPDDDPTQPLKKVREKHHSLARLIAGGLNQRMAAALSGYTESYVSILLNNPAMTELVEMYRVQSGAAVQVITEKLKTVGMKALEKLDDAMDSQQALDHHVLLGIAKLGLDRGGHGPSSSHHVVAESHTFDHARIKELNDKARANSIEHIIPMREVRAAALPAPAAPAQETPDE